MINFSGKKAHKFFFRNLSQVPAGSGLFFRFRFFSAILLLAVLSCSGSGILHELWHRQPESCENTAHSCRNERLGVKGDAWQKVVHDPVNFHIPAFNCPVCSGLSDCAEKAALPDFQHKASISDHGQISHELWRFSADIKIPSPRGPPALS